MNCPGGAAGTFTSSGTNLGLTNGIVLTTGVATSAVGPNSSGGDGMDNGGLSTDPDILNIEPDATYNTCVLEFDIVPQCDQLSIRFVFGSEEYPEFVNSSYNDVFGFFITGPNPMGGNYTAQNIATLPSGTIVSIDNVSPSTNSNYYVNNTGGAYVQYDGFTTVITSTVNLVPCQSYHFKLAIADAGDAYWDSGVFVDFLQCTYVMDVATTVTPASCSCDGSANATATSGVGPFTYSWSPTGGTSPTASNLCPGTYIVTVDDAYTCSPSITDTVIVTSAATFTATISSTNVTCSGANNGTASVTVSGGTGPFTYSWSPLGGTGPTASNLPPGTYTVTITDASGCSLSLTVTITEPPPLTSVTSQTNVSCNGANDGTASISISGGTPSYSYLWVPNVSSTSTAGNLLPGNYTITTTDSNGCQRVDNFTITEPPALQLSTTSTPDTCAASVGTATVSASGGTPGYQYLWSNGSTSSTISNLTANTYSIAVTDAVGCIANSAATVNSTGGPNLLLSSITNASCFSSCDGSATFTSSGGAAPITYNWSPSGGTGLSATNLCAGNYVLTATDATGCSSSAAVNIVEPTQLVTSTTFTDAKCFNECNGTGSTTPSGGTAPYTYSWSNGSTLQSPADLCSGANTVTVTDSNGCSTSSTVTINQPAQLTLSLAGFNEKCVNSCDGEVVVIPSGGTSPYTAVWSSGCASFNCEDLCPGTYSVTITDAVGCMASGVATVGSAVPISTTLNATNANCGKSNGSICANSTGGTGTFTYSWTTPIQTSTCAVNVPQGTYCVIATDGNQCKDTACGIVNDVPGFTLSAVNIIPVDCYGNCNGSATVDVLGGTPPFTFQWTNGTTSQTVNNLCAGTYCVVVTDSIDCTDTLCIVITEPTILTVDAGIGDTICIGQTSVLSPTVVGGTPGYTFSWTPSGPSVSPNVTTTYTVTATDANGCISAPSSVEIFVRPPLTIQASADTTICTGTVAQLFSTASGGSGNYSYSWAPGNSTNANVSVLPSSTTEYFVTVNDDCGTAPAVDSVTVVVLNPPEIYFTPSIDSGCAPLCVTFTEQTTPASVSCNWNFGDGGVNDSSCAPTYCYSNPGLYDVTLTVTDINGCSNTATIPDLIDVFSLPEANFIFTPESTTILEPTISFLDQSIDAVNYQWSFGDVLNSNSTLQNPFFTYPDSGCYDVQLIVEAANSCIDTTNKIVCILGDYALYVPNAFSPNGDGINDVFIPQGIGVDLTAYELFIFDRWGDLIFRTADLYQGWDGKANNGSKVAQIDTYVWKIVAKDFLGDKHRYIGHVSLIR